MSPTRTGEGDGEPVASRLWRDVADDLTEALHSIHLAQTHEGLPPEVRTLVARTASRLDRAIARLSELEALTRASASPGPAPDGVPTAPPTGPAPTLSPREREVLALLAEGLSNQGIAARLGVGTATAKSHVQRLLAKLQARNRTQAALQAARLGLVNPPP